MPVVQADTQSEATSTPTRAELELDHIGSILKSRSDVASQLEVELPALLTARDAAFRRFTRAAKLPLSLCLGWRLPSFRTKLDLVEGRLREAVARRNGCWTVLRFSFGERTLEGFRNLAIAFGALSTVKSLWSVAALSSSSFSTPVSGVGLKRQAVRTGPTLPEQVDSDWPGLAFQHADGGKLELYPGFALTGVGADTKLTSLLDFNLEASEAVIAEDIDPPTDAVVVQRIWEKANKDGSPDRRFTSNRRIPIVRYGLLRFSAPGVGAVSYLVSNPHVALCFATAFADFQRCMAKEAASQPSAATQDGAMMRPKTVKRAFASVPPPPIVGQAHEYTIATAVMVAISGWLLLTGPVGGRQVVASDAGPPPARSEAGSQHSPSPEPVIRPEPVSAGPPSGLTASEPQTASTAAASPTPLPQDAAAAQTRERVMIRNGGANIRSGPNGSTDVIRTTSGGTHLNVFGRSNGWVRVGDTEAWGWVHSSLLEGIN